MFAIVAGGIGFVLGGLGGDDEGQASKQAADASAAPKASTQAPASNAGDDGAAKVAAAPPAKESPCPEGMVKIDGGKFFMGTDRDAGILRMARPAHQVEVGPYCMDIYEVRVDDYRSCSDKGECKRAFRESKWPGSDESEVAWNDLCNESYDDRGQHPVNCVTWEQSKHYCEQRGARLPTESEWEYAARGSDGRVYPWGDEAPDQRHMNGCGTECRDWRADKELSANPAVLHETNDRYPGTAPVGSFPAGKTQWGLHDIAGNVFEWTADAFEPYPGAEKEPEKDGGTPARRVIRGGAFNSFFADFADPALRFPQVETAHTHGIGFRCAADVRE
ncbi:MAG: SUMF1/EgtB/PvdO family nonheme iron enzyme [Myxococcota bacterium]